MMAACVACGETSNDPGSGTPTTSGPTSSAAGTSTGANSSGAAGGSTSGAAGASITTTGAGGSTATGPGPTGATGGSASTTSGSSGSAGSSAGGSGGTGTGGAGATGLQATQLAGGYFPPGSFFYQDISTAKVAADSTIITQWMESFAAPNGFGGSGMGSSRGYFTIDLSIITVDVPSGTAKRPFQTVSGFYFAPDCDTAPPPVPAGGAVEGASGTAADFMGRFSGYLCPGFAQGADCHLLLLSRGEHRLYEIYHANIDAGGVFSGGCLALWDTSKVYDIHGRGDQCTSADAAGYPMAPLLFTAEEIKAGSINHAIRFALPNDMLRAKVYVSPATHGTNTTGPATSLPYGARMRLKTPYAGMSQLSASAQVVARALQKYGMVHADGGNVPLMGQSDLLGAVKYADVGFDTHALLALKATDFEVLEYPAPIPVTNDCTRTQITQ